MQAGAPDDGAGLTRLIFLGPTPKHRVSLEHFAEIKEKNKTAEDKGKQANFSKQRPCIDFIL